MNCKWASRTTRALASTRVAKVAQLIGSACIAQLPCRTSRMETVTMHAGTQQHLRAILRGDFQCVFVGEVVQQQGGVLVDKANLYAVRCSSEKRAELPLGAEVRLLQVDDNVGGCCYLLAEQAKVLLHLTGEHAHVFERLCERSQIEPIHRRPDQHFETVQATHLNPMSMSMYARIRLTVCAPDPRYAAHRGDFS